MGRQERRGATWAVGRGHSALTSVFSERSHSGDGKTTSWWELSVTRTSASHRHPILTELSLVLGVSFLPLKRNPRQMFLSSSSLELSVQAQRGLLPRRLRESLLNVNLSRGFLTSVSLAQWLCRRSPQGTVSGALHNASASWASGGVALAGSTT